MVVLSCCLGCTCSDRERPVVLSVLSVLVRGSLPCLWVRLVCVWPDALLGLPALGRERMVICCVLTFQLVLVRVWWPRAGWCILFALMFVLSTLLSSFCYLVPASVPC